METSCEPLSLTNDNSKLIRTNTIAEIPQHTRKIVLEQQSLYTEQNNRLYRRFSCEQILDQYSNVRHMRVSQVTSSFPHEENNLERHNILKTNRPLQLSIVKTSNDTSEQNNGARRKSVERAFSCNDINKSGLEPSIKRLSLRSKHSLLALPPPPSSVELPATSQAEIKYSNVDSNVTKNLIELPPFNQPKFKTNIRSLLIQQQEISKHSNMNFENFRRFLFIICISFCIILIATSVRQDDLVSLCSPLMNFSKIKTELPQRIYGQNDGVQKLITVLDTRITGFEIITIVGGTGVGKSHTANIIKQLVENDYTIMEYVPPLDSKDSVAYKRLTACKCNLIILDNILTKNIKEIVTFCHNLKIRVKNYCVLILILINTQDINDKLEKSLDMNRSIKMLESIFKEKDLYPKIVGYDPLEIEILDHCILEAAEYFNVTISANDIEQIRKYLITLQSGCKGAYAKVQVFGKEKTNFN